ncbi:MAG: sugar phosphate isomerase/epimerase [Clostridia bacterium]|nr:sugar phosphate isomerase/epimerase [Clostridia bacterium]
MEYGIKIGYFIDRIGLEKSAELVSKAGFTQLDYTPAVRKDTWEAEMKEALDVFKAYGLSVNQTHAPFNRYGSCKGIHKLCVERCAEATAYMGAKYMVAHADEFDFEKMIYSPEAALDYNHKLFLPFVEQAEKSDYKIAFETVFQDSRPKPRFTSDATDLMNVIKSFNSESVACCWDSGHANLAFKKEAPEVARKFGSLIQCTHLHDNIGTVDAHQMPLTGAIDWKALMAVFKEFNYSGVLNIELGFGSFPEYLMPEFIELNCKALKHIWTL